jgi:microcystin-dependent protein
MSNSAIGATGAIAALPAGVMIDYAATVAPAGWLMCDGSAVSRTTFASLFATISTLYGVGDGSTTFNLPDFRGRFARYMDNMGTPAGAAGRDTGRVLGATAQAQATAKNGLGAGTTYSYPRGDVASTTATPAAGSAVYSFASLSNLITITGDTETRPINLACNRIIKV